MAPLWDWIVVDGDLRVGVTTSRREYTTSTVVVAGHRALLVDPAWDPDELTSIARDLADAHIEVVAGFATHAHHDHLLWHPELGDAPRWASGPAAAAAKRHRTELHSALGPNWPAKLGELVGLVTATEGDLVPWDGPDVQLVSHSAHAAGHTALWIPATGVLVAGDMLSDVELPLLEHSSAADYDKGLAALEPVVAAASILVPGHGRIAVGPTAIAERWRADRGYLQGLRAAASSTDPRLGNPGMPTAHRHNQRRTRERAT